MQQQFETKEAERRGLTQAEYSEVLLRAQRIRAEKEGSLSRDVLVESAAEVGIREEDIREAERQLELEKQQLARQQQALAQKRNSLRMAGAGAAGVLALTMVFSYNSLNAELSQAQEARANLQSTFQRRADTIPQVTRAVERGSASQAELARQLAAAQADLQSNDLERQIRGNEALKQLVANSTELQSDLVAEIAGAENRINVARQRYNQQAAEYNRAARSFPTGVFRPFFGMPGNMPLFEATVKSGTPSGL